MRRAILVILFLLLAFDRAGFAEDAATLFARANESYRAQRYGEAALLYDEIVRQKTVSGPIFYNLANAYFKTGELGRAIVNYERALQWMPRDAEVRANYRYARSLVQEVEGQQKQGLMERLLQGHFQFYTFHELAWILFFLAMGLALAHLGGLYFQWAVPRKRLVLGLLLALMVFYGVGSGVRMSALSGRAVMIQETGALFEPRQEATVYFKLFQGNVVKVRKTENGWVKVERFDGKTGWVRENSVEGVAGE